MASYYTIEEPIQHPDLITKSRVFVYGAFLAAMCTGALLFTDSATSTQFSVAVPTFIRQGTAFIQNQRTPRNDVALRAVAADVPLSLDTLSSRVDRPIALPPGVKLFRKDGVLKVEGPKGSLERPIPDEVVLREENGILLVAFESPSRNSKAMFGLYQALIKNMVIGVSQAFEKKMEMIGVGYRARVDGTNLVLAVGKSHDVVMPIPDGLKVTVEENIRIVVSGLSNELVGQFCANVRKERPPEPYKGKGIRYLGEKIIMKVGKGGKGKK